MSIEYYDKKKDKWINPYKVFLGECFGIAFNIRESDQVLIFTILVEDDGYWYIQKHGGNSFWLSEFAGIVNDALQWLKSNCELTPEGWKVKK